MAKRRTLRTVPCLASLQFVQHFPDVPGTGAGLQNLAAFLVRTELQNFDVHVANAPALHRAVARHVEVDGVGADQGRAVILDDENIRMAKHAEAGAERETRPIGGCAAGMKLRTVRAQSPERVAFCSRNFMRQKRSRSTGFSASRSIPSSG